MTNHQSINVSTLALEFWEALGEVPVSHRDASLGKPIYTKLLDLLIRRLSYPADFVSWEEEVNMDPEDFAR